MGELLRERLSYPPGSTSRFVFGSVASGAEKAYSDIDLMVVGRTNLRQLANLISGLNVELGREVNPHLLTHEEFIIRKNAGDHFLGSVLRSPKLFIVGSDDDLEASNQR